MSESYYDILGIDRSASDDDIRKKFKELTKKYHPDLHPNDKEAEEKYKKITSAYEVLSNPEKRNKYDSCGNENSQFSNDFSGFEDIIRQGFGGFGGFSGFNGFDNDQGPVKGQDIVKRCRISLKDAYLGRKITIRYQREVQCHDCNGKGYSANGAKSKCGVCNGTGHVQTITRTQFGQNIQVFPCNTCGGKGYIISNPCSKCNGSGISVDTEVIDINIHPGTLFGERMRFAGKGCIGKNNGPNGDLYVIIESDEYNNYMADPNGSPHLIYKLSLDYYQAILGDNIKIKSIDDREILINIKPGTQKDDKIVINGEGLKSTVGTGNLIVIVNVIIPTAISEEEKKLLNKIKKLNKKDDEKRTKKNRKR